jgi:hypothetical protein
MCEHRLVGVNAVSNLSQEVSQMAKDHGPSIMDDERYEALREEGMSKEKAARIANTPPDEMEPRGGGGAPYEEWTREELYEKARDVGIEGRSGMSKDELIEALRS